ncbi:MAG: LysR family transcriptional regulator [Agathobacter sp.]
MNFKSIRYFITLAHCLNFTQAANKHHITQTAISRYIASLEEQVGVKLFDRSSRKVTLTEAGKIYAEGMEKMLKEYDKLLERTKAAGNTYQGHIKVGIGIYEYSNTEEFFSKFLETYPEIKIDIFQFSYSTLIEQFKSNELDLIISLDTSKESYRENQVRCVDLFTSENVLVINREKMEEKYAQSKVEEILRSEYLVTNCEDSGPNSLKMLRGLLERDFGFVPEQIVQTNSLSTQLLMARTGHGVAIVPAFISEIKDNSLAILKLPQKKPQRYCALQKADSRNEAATLFMDFLEQE